MFDRRGVLQNVLAGGIALSMFRPAELLAAEDPYLRFVHPELRGMAAGILKTIGGAPLLTWKTCLLSGRE